jgi:hypothetical protein
MTRYRTIKYLLNYLGGLGYGVYKLPDGFAVADPRDDDQGLYLHGPNLKELLEEAVEVVNVGLKG